MSWSDVYGMIYKMYSSDFWSDHFCSLQRCTLLSRFHEWNEVVPLTTFPGTTALNRRGKKETIVEEDAFQKISALEDELAHLRAQIAAIVTVPGARNGNLSSKSVWLLIMMPLLLVSLALKMPGCVAFSHRMLSS